MVRLNGKWESWICDGNYLWSPENKRFKPNDMLKAQWYRAMYDDECGEEYDIRSLKRHLQKRVSNLERSPRDHSHLIEILIQALQKSIA